MATTDAQVRKLMEEMSKHGEIGRAALRADMDRNTAAKYVAAGKLPSEMRAPRDWRTRRDPFEDDWPEIKALLESDPGLEAKTIFEDLLRRKPERYQERRIGRMSGVGRVWASVRRARA